MTSKNPKKFLVKNALVILCMVLIINTIPSMGQKLPDSIQINQVLKAADRIVNRDIRDSINFEDILELDLVYSHMNDTSYLVEASRYLGIYYRSIFAFDDSEKYLLKGLELAKTNQKLG